jgi:hypothetical protein
MAPTNTIKGRILGDRVVTFRQRLIGAIVILLASVLIVAVFEKRQNRTEKLVHQCLEASRNAKERNDEIIREAKRILEQTRKERDEIKRQLELCQQNEDVQSK